MTYLVTFVESDAAIVPVDRGISADGIALQSVMSSRAGAKPRESEKLRGAFASPVRLSGCNAD